MSSPNELANNPNTSQTMQYIWDRMRTAHDEAERRQMSDLAAYMYSGALGNLSIPPSQLKLLEPLKTMAHYAGTLDTMRSMILLMPSLMEAAKQLEQNHGLPVDTIKKVVKLTIDPLAIVKESGEFVSVLAQNTADSITQSVKRMSDTDELSDKDRLREAAKYALPHARRLAAFNADGIQDAANMLMAGVPKLAPTAMTAASDFLNTSPKVITQAPVLEAPGIGPLQMAANIAGENSAPYPMPNVKAAPLKADFWQPANTPLGSGVIAHQFQISEDTSLYRLNDGNKTAYFFRHKGNIINQPIEVEIPTQLALTIENIIANPSEKLEKLLNRQVREFVGDLAFAYQEETRLLNGQYSIHKINEIASMEKSICRIITGSVKDNYANSVLHVPTVRFDIKNILYGDHAVLVDKATGRVWLAEDELSAKPSYRQIEPFQGLSIISHEMYLPPERIAQLTQMYERVVNLHLSGTLTIDAAPTHKTTQIVPIRNDDIEPPYR